MRWVLCIVAFVAAFVLVPLTAAAEPPTVQLGTDLYSVGESSGVLTVAVTLNIASGDTVTVDYATADGTATAGSDYTSAAGTLIFVPGDTNETFALTILGDGFDETDETLTIALSGATNAVLGTPLTTTVVIADDDGPNVGFSAPAYSVGENGVTAIVTASLSTASVQVVTVDCAITGGTASRGADYTASNRTLIFDPGDSSETFSITLIDDSGDEVDETINLALSNADNAVLVDPTTTTVTIVDNDGPSVSFQYTSYVLTEGQGSASIAVKLSASSPQTITVDYASGVGTATAGSDYTAVNSTLTFQPGETTQTFQIVVVDDGNDEVDETVPLTLSNPLRASLGAAPMATLTIADDDGPAASFSPGSYSVSEGAANVTLTVTLSYASVQAVTVHYATSNGTATAGSDYTATSGTLTFAVGEVTKTFAVQVSNDTLDELDETVTVTLSAPTNASLGTPNPTAITILDNDIPPTVQFSAGSYSSGESGGAITISATLSTASGTTVLVDYATSDGSAASGSDYTPASGTLTFQPGATTASFSVGITSDEINEASETIGLALSNAVRATLGSAASATITIVDDDGAEITFQAASFTAGEGAGTAVVTVTLDRIPATEVTVVYATSNGTALATADYTAETGTLTFLPGDPIESFDIALNNDSLDEAAETINLTLSAPNGGYLGTPSTAVLVIDDDDPAPLLQFAAASYSATEGGSVVITVSLSAASGQAVGADYATVDGSAIAGSDYTAKTGRVNIVAGATSFTFTVPTTNDTLDEPEETVGLTLNNLANCSLGANGTATLTILDNDNPPSIQFVSSAYSVLETEGTASVTVTLSAPSALSVTVNYAAGGGTATVGSDYTATSGILTFSPGETTKSFGVPVIHDDTTESTETVTLTLSNPGNGTLGSRRTATLSISDFMPPPTVQFSSANYSVNESGGSATITVTLSGPGQSVTVDYATSNGTATAGSDYAAKTGRLTFATGATSMTFSISITNDTGDEDDETVTLVLSNPTNATFGATTLATLTIVDNDSPPAAQFQKASFSVSEKSGTATVTVTLAVSPLEPVTLDYATSDGTARAGEDYVAQSGTLTFLPGEKTKTFSITIVNDTIDEADETIELTLSNPVKASLGSTQTAVLTITDDDPSPTVQFSAATYSADESDGTAVIAVVLSTASGQSVSVGYATSNGTATIPADAVATSGTLTFEPGETSKTFSVRVVSDGITEADETLKLTLSSPNKVTLGSTRTATLTIVDKPWQTRIYIAGVRCTV